MGWNQLLGLDLLSPKVQTELKANVDASQYMDSRNISTQYSYSPTSQFTDSRQLVLVLNSAGATTTTKKAERVAQDAASSQESAQSLAPKQEGARVPFDVSLPSLGGGSSWGLLLIGAAVIGGAFLLTRKGGKK